MGDLIAWKTAEEVIKIITAENAMVAGMSIEEAAKALGYTLTKSGMYVKTVTTATSVAGAGATAGEAIAGATATGGAAASTANLTLYTTASGTTAVGGLGSIALPAAACCLAAAGGYAIGNVTGEMIDEAFPDFFDGLFCSVSKFLTGDERSLAFIFDEKGEAYMPEDSQLAINSYLQQQLAEYNTNYVKIGDFNLPYEKTIGDGHIFHYASDSNTTYYWVEKLDVLKSEKPVYHCVYYAPNSFCHIFASEAPFELNISQHAINWKDNSYRAQTGTRTPSAKTSFTLNNKNIYGLSYSSGLMNNLSHFLPLMPLKVFYWSELKTLFPKIDSYQIMYYMLYGDKVDSKLPNIGKFERPDKPKIEVPSKYPSWMPVPLPATYPSKLPLETPDPNNDPDPSKVTPYLPQPQPYPDGVPAPKPNPNPDPHPVVIPDPNPKPNPVPPPDPDPSKDPVPTPTPTPTPTPKPPTPTPTPVPPIPVIPPIGGDAGLLHVYNPTSEQINEFGRWLWTTFSGDLLDTLAKLFNNPMDAVIGLHELYCTPSTGSSTTIKAGFLDSGVTSRLVSSRYTEINCGAITVPEYWGNYLDYAPYTKVYCYLPFIGIVELNTDDIIGHGVQILYKVDSYNGSCIAMIITAKTPDSEGTIYQFSGNCAVEVPITSGMKSALQSALIGAATCAVGAMGAGLAGVAVTDAAIVGGAKRGLNSKNTVAHSGSFGSSYGAMGIKKPYIIVKRPVQKKVYGYNKEYGYPAHQMVTVGSCSGYLRAREFEVKSTTATEEEKKRIEILLKEGVYV